LARIAGRVWEGPIAGFSGGGDRDGAQVKI